MNRLIAGNLSSSETQGLLEHDNTSLLANGNSIKPHERQRQTAGRSNLARWSAAPTDDTCMAASSLEGRLVYIWPNTRAVQWKPGPRFSIEDLSRQEPVRPSILNFIDVDIHLWSLWQRKEHLEQLRIIWRSQPSSWIPARRCREAISAASRGVARSNIVEYLRILVQCGIDEADRAFTHSRALVVDHRDQRRPDRCCERGAELCLELACEEGREVCAVRSNV